MIHKKLEIVDCLISVKMNCHSLERTIKQRECFRHLPWFAIMVVNFFKLKIELIDIELNVVELIVIELVDTE